MHDAIAAELDARRDTGGSADLDAESNGDLAYIYAVAVGQLAEKNLLWADAFART